MPSTALAVDGSARTFTCDDVIPSIGTVVAEGADGRRVLVRCGVSVGDKVTVGMRRVGEAFSDWEMFVEQPAIISTATITLNTTIFEFTS